VPDEKPDRIPAVAAAMTPFPWVIDVGASLVRAREMMIEHHFRHLPVVENGRIYGVVSRGDFTGIEIDRLDEEEHLSECIW
jgi:CBS domain-containing protein